MIRRQNCIWSTVLLGMLAQAASAQPVETLDRLQFERVLMGTSFRIVVYGADSNLVAGAAVAAFTRVESLNRILSDYLPDSELNNVSGRSGTGEEIAVSDDLWTVLASAQRLANETDGAFDVTVGPLTLLWRRAMRRGTVPGSSELAEKRSSVGYWLMELDSISRSVRLLKPGIRLDLGGIAKGYAVDEAFQVLRGAGFERTLVDGGGDMRLGAPPPGRDGWEIAVGHVDSAGRSGSRTLLLSNTALATSGDRFRYVDVDGIRYSHILDPTTGMGITTDREVTVFAPTCMEADALASALSVLGTGKASNLLTRYPGSSARFVEARDGGYHMSEIPRAEQ